MDPLSLAFMGIGAGASGLGAIFGADATSEAADKNWQINLLNYYQRQQEHQDAIVAAQQAKRDKTKQQNEQKLGYTDAQGNSTRFIPGQGWVTENSSTGQELLNLNEKVQKAQGQEQLDRLNEDVPLQRAQLKRNFSAQGDAGLEADALLRQFQDIQRPDTERLASMMFGKAADGINRGFANTASQASRTAVRTGASNTGKILAEIGRAHADQLGKAESDAELQAMMFGDDQYNKNRNAAAALYQAFSGAANKPIDAAYQPQSVDSSGNSVSASALKGMQSDLTKLTLNDGNDELIKAFGAKGGSMDYVQPDMGLANGLASMGNMIGSMGSNISSKNRLDSLRKSNGSI